MLRLFLKRFLLNKIYKAKSLPVVFALILFYIGLSCGKRKPPLPPTETVLQKVRLEGFQRGNSVNLSWQMPVRNSANSNLLNIDRVDVYRLAETSEAPQRTLSEEEFSSQSTLIAALPVTNQDFRLKKFNFTDVLQFAGQNARLRYAIRLVNASGQKAAFSNFLLIEPTAKIANAPNLLKIDLQEKAVEVKWIAPQTNIDGSKPANIAGYNIYRSKSETEPAILLNETPVNITSYSDKAFEFGTQYYYFVRAISLGANGDSLESLESNIVAIFPKDIFPPNPPAAITIAAAPNNLAIFFAANLEDDVAGYRIFRSTDKNLSLQKWSNLTPDLLLTNTFQDLSVESGKTYYYYLVAVDKAGNSSEPSEIVTETAP